MSLTIEKNQGIRLRLAGATPAMLHQGREAGGYYKVRSYHGGGEFFQQENAQLILQCLGEFLPRATERPSVSGDGMEIVYQHLVDGQDVCGSSTSLDAGAEVPKSELNRLEEAIAKLKTKENDAATDPTKREIIRAFRLPDPRKDPELWRLHRSKGETRLLVLWGVEKEAGSSLVPQDAVKHVPQRRGGIPWWVWLLLALLLLALLCWWLGRKHNDNAITAAALSSNLPVVTYIDQPVNAKTPNSPTRPQAGYGERPSTPANATNTPSGQPLSTTPATSAATGNSAEPGSNSPPSPTGVPTAPVQSNPLVENPVTSSPPPSSASSTAPPAGETSKSPVLGKTAPAANAPAMPVDSKPPEKLQGSAPTDKPASPTTPAPRNSDRPEEPKFSPNALPEAKSKMPSEPNTPESSPPTPDSNPPSNSPSIPAQSSPPPLAAEIVNGRTSATPKDGKVEMQLSLLARDTDGKAITLSQVKSWSVDGKVQTDDAGKPLTTNGLPVKLTEGKHRVSAQGISADGRNVRADAEVNVDIAVRQESTVRMKQLEK